MNKCKTIGCGKETTHHIRVSPKGMEGVTYTLMCCDKHVEIIQEDMKVFSIGKDLEINVVKLN